MFVREAREDGDTKSQLCFIQAVWCFQFGAWSPTLEQSMGSAGSDALASLLDYTSPQESSPWTALAKGNRSVSYFQLLAGRKKKGEGRYL